MTKNDNMETGLGEKLGFLSFSTSQNIGYNFKNLYYLIFLTNILGIDVLVAGTLITIGTVWDAVNDPIIGLWVSNRSFRNGERLRPYILYCSFPWAVTLVLLFSNFHTNQTLAAIIWLAVYFVYESMNTLLSIPYNAMASLAAGSDSDRKSINSYRSLGMALGAGTGSIAVTPLVKLFGGLKGQNAILSPADSKAMTMTAAALGIIGILGAVHHYLTTRERVKPIEKEEKARMSMGEAYRILFRCRSWVLNMIYIVCYSVSITLIMAAINYYAAYIVGSSAAAVPMMGMYLITAVITSVVTPRIDDRIGRKRMMYLAAIVLIAAKIPFILKPYSLANVYLNSVATGIGATITFIVFNTNRNNIADIVEMQSGRRMDAMVANGDNLVSKLAQAGATQLMAFALAAAGFSESLKMDQTPATVNTIIALLGWVPLIITIIKLVVVIMMDIDRETQSAIKEREARNALHD